MGGGHKVDEEVRAKAYSAVVKRMQASKALLAGNGEGIKNSIARSRLRNVENIWVSGRGNALRRTPIR